MSAFKMKLCFTCVQLAVASCNQLLAVFELLLVFTLTFLFYASYFLSSYFVVFHVWLALDLALNIFVSLSQFRPHLVISSFLSQYFLKPLLAKTEGSQLLEPYAVSSQHHGSTFSLKQDNIIHLCQWASKPKPIFSCFNKSVFFLGLNPRSWHIAWPLLQIL